MMMRPACVYPPQPPPSLEMGLQNEPTDTIYQTDRDVNMASFTFMVNGISMGTGQQQPPPQSSASMYPSSMFTQQPLPHSAPFPLLSTTGYVAQLPPQQQQQHRTGSVDLTSPPPANNNNNTGQFSSPSTASFQQQPYLSAPGGTVVQLPPGHVILGSNGPGGSLINNTSSSDKLPNRTPSAGGYGQRSTGGLVLSQPTSSGVASVVTTVATTCCPGLATTPANYGFMMSLTQQQQQQQRLSGQSTTASGRPTSAGGTATGVLRSPTVAGISDSFATASDMPGGYQTTGTPVYVSYAPGIPGSLVQASSAPSLPVPYSMASMSNTGPLPMMNCSSANSGSGCTGRLNVPNNFCQTAAATMPSPGSMLVSAAPIGNASQQMAGGSTCGRALAPGMALSFTAGHPARMLTPTPVQQHYVQMPGNFRPAVTTNNMHQQQQQAMLPRPHGGANCLPSPSIHHHTGAQPIGSPGPLQAQSSTGKSNAALGGGTVFAPALPTANSGVCPTPPPGAGVMMLPSGQQPTNGGGAGMAMMVMHPSGPGAGAVNAACLPARPMPSDSNSGNGTTGGGGDSKVNSYITPDGCCYLPNTPTLQRSMSSGCSSRPSGDSSLYSLANNSATGGGGAGSSGLDILLTSTGPPQTSNFALHSGMMMTGYSSSSTTGCSSSSTSIQYTAASQQHQQPVSADFEGVPASCPSPLMMLALPPGSSSTGAVMAPAPPPYHHHHHHHPQRQQQQQQTSRPVLPPSPSSGIPITGYFTSLPPSSTINSSGMLLPGPGILPSHPSDIMAIVEGEPGLHGCATVPLPGGGYQVTPNSTVSNPSSGKRGAVGVSKTGTGATRPKRVRPSKAAGASGGRGSKAGGKKAAASGNAASEATVISTIASTNQLLPDFFSASSSVGGAGGPPQMAASRLVVSGPTGKQRQQQQPLPSGWPSTTPTMVVYGGGAGGYAPPPPAALPSPGGGGGHHHQHLAMPPPTFTTAAAAEVVSSCSSPATLLRPGSTSSTMQLCGPPFAGPLLGSVDSNPTSGGVRFGPSSPRPQAFQQHFFDSSRCASPNNGPKINGGIIAMPVHPINTTVTATVLPAGQHQLAVGETHCLPASAPTASLATGITSRPRPAPVAPPQSPVPFVCQPAGTMRPMRLGQGEDFATAFNPSGDTDRLVCPITNGMVWGPVQLQLAEVMDQYLLNGGVYTYRFEFELTAAHLNTILPRNDLDIVVCSHLVSEPLQVCHWPPAEAVQIRFNDCCLRLDRTSVGRGQSAHRVACVKQLCRSGRNQLEIAILGLGEDPNDPVTKARRQSTAGTLEVHRFAAFMAHMPELKLLLDGLQRRRPVGVSFLCELLEQLSQPGSDGSASQRLAVSELSLVCPIFGTRMRVPGRITGCEHVSAFDMEAFLRREVLWPRLNCPICGHKSPVGLDGLCIDTTISCVYQLVPASVDTILVRSDGCWRLPPPLSLDLPPELDQWQPLIGPMTEAVSLAMEKMLRVTGGVTPPPPACQPDTTASRSSSRVDLRQAGDCPPTQRRSTLPDGVSPSAAEKPVTSPSLVFSTSSEPAVPTAPCLFQPVSWSSTTNGELGGSSSLGIGTGGVGEEGVQTAPPVPAVTTGDARSNTECISFCGASGQQQSALEGNRLEPGDSKVPLGGGSGGLVVTAKLRRGSTGSYKSFLPSTYDLQGCLKVAPEPHSVPASPTTTGLSAEFMQTQQKTTVLVKNAGRDSLLALTTSGATTTTTVERTGPFPALANHHVELSSVPLSSSSSGEATAGNSAPKNCTSSLNMGLDFLLAEDDNHMTNSSNSTDSVALDQLESDALEVSGGDGGGDAPSELFHQTPNEVVMPMAGDRVPDTISGAGSTLGAEGVVCKSSPGGQPLGDGTDEVKYVNSPERGNASGQEHHHQAEGDLHQIMIRGSDLSGHHTENRSNPYPDPRASLSPRTTASRLLHHTNEETCTSPVGQSKQQGHSHLNGDLITDSSSCGSGQFCEKPSKCYDEVDLVRGNSGASSQPFQLRHPLVPNEFDEEMVCEEVVQKLSSQVDCIELFSDDSYIRFVEAFPHV